MPTYQLLRILSALDGANKVEEASVMMEAGVFTTVMPNFRLLVTIDAELIEGPRFSGTDQVENCCAIVDRPRSTNATNATTDTFVSNKLLTDMVMLPSREE